MGVLQVGRAFVQYAQPLASGSRPSWSRGGSHKPRGRSRRRTTTSRPRSGVERGQWGRTWGEGVGLRRKNPAEPMLKAVQCPQR